jgi:hypothetical protein
MSASLASSSRLFVASTTLTDVMYRSHIALYLVTPDQLVFKDLEKACLLKPDTLHRTFSAKASCACLFGFSFSKSVVASSFREFGIFPYLLVGRYVLLEPLFFAAYMLLYLREFSQSLRWVWDVFILVFLQTRPHSLARIHLPYATDHLIDYIFVLIARLKTDTILVHLMYLCFLGTNSVPVLYKARIVQRRLRAVMMILYHSTAAISGGQRSRIRRLQNQYVCR